ncbi:AsmA-like C-terminal region [Hymenobacter daecheongensis DSM 21074]|uniref:AsmA-like C-terminal region n=2 Tax=Hymenobacter daecheongensis TaxID=496053 RepID=A0A1M6EWU9_9BACT|nr:AsmA-like C-terminal region [Hymenobacter daecheongensis DSM 21074]
MLRRLLLAGFLLLLLVSGLALWLLGSDYGRRHLEQRIRQRLTHDSELVLAPFEVHLSLWQDFPHLTASLHHLSLLDTAYRQRVPVLSVGRADARLALAGLLRGRVQISRLTIREVEFREQVDAHGRSWGLHGKKRGPRRGAPTPPDLTLDSLIVRNFRFRSRNEYARSAFGASVRVARLAVRLRGGVLQATGTLAGALDYLRNPGGTLFEREPVWAGVRYQYAFRARQGTIYRTRATLNGDTIRIRGTHTAGPGQPGTLLNLAFAGTQPLTEVLRAALPQAVQPYLAGAKSPSKAHIRYTIRGLSGPTVSPHNVLTFGLRGARLIWPDPARRITHWDLLGTYDNGPGRSPQTTSLTLNHCRITSSAGRLDATLLLLDFTRPFVNARVRGRTELGQLAALVSPGVWRARRGTAELDVRLRGLLPPAPGRRMARRPQKKLSVRGTVTLRDASFVIPDRGADMAELNVRVGLRDSVWRLSNASGVLDQMRFRASATTVNLFDYLTDQHPTTRISGDFAVEDLRVARLRELLRPIARPKLPLDAPRRPRPVPASVANLGSNLIPKGMQLNVHLRCRRLLLPTDTLTDLAVRVRHDGRNVQLTHLAGALWGGRVRGTATWPTDTANRVATINFQLGVHFDTINYRRFLGRISRPAQRSAKAPAAPALRELLLAANGHLTCDVTTVQLPDGEDLRNLRLELTKTGSTVQLPMLRFATTRGGTGFATASARVADNRLVAAEASLDLRYHTLDVQKLLQLLASFNPTTAKDDEDEAPPARADSTAVASALPLDRAARRAARAARRAQLNGLPARKPDGTIISNGILTAVLRVQADNVRYAALTGRQFRLVSHLSKGEARLDDCSLDAFEGRLTLRGRMITNAGRQHHPLYVQLQLQDIQLPLLFGAATSMGLNVLGANNVRGTLRCAADVRTDLDATFLPVFDETLGYLKTDIRGLELLDVEALAQALKFMKAERTGHLFFEPVSSEFILNRGQLLIPDLDLNSNLSNLQVSGRYFLDGRADLYVGLNPMQALFGNNDKRIERIRNNQLVRRASRLTYLGLSRPAPGVKYKVRPFQRDEQRRQQIELRQQYRRLLFTQRLDTTVKW